MINIDDIIKRSNYINLSNQSDEYKKYHNKTKLLKESTIDRFSDTKFILQHWQSLNENQVECFKCVIDLLDEAYEKDNVNEYNYIKSYIINEVSPTVRDAKQTIRYLKYKTTRMKNKISENIKKNTQDIQDTAKLLIDNIKNTNSKSISTVKKNVKKSLGKKDLHETYIQILDSLDKYNHCDRILENVNIIQRRFNIMNMVNETDISDEYKLRVLVDSICECVNTYDVDTSTRFNSVLETCFYFLERRKIPFNRSLVLEETVDNFICKDFTDKDLLDIKTIIEYSPIIESESKKNVEYIFNTLTEEGMIKSIPDKSKNDVCKIIGESSLVMDLDILYEEGIVQYTVKDIVNSFKLKRLKSTTDVRTCISKIFTKSPEQIINGTPNFLSWIRLSWIIGATAINPILGGVALFVDQFIAMDLKRRDISKMITVFKNERKNVEEKMKKADEKDKHNLKEYDKYLKNGIAKLEEYEETLLSDGEIEARINGEEYDKDKDLAILKDDDFELEATSFEKLFEKSNFFSKDYFTNNISNYISSMNENTIDIITDIACKYPSIISINRLYTILKEELDEIKNQYSDNKNWIRMSCLTSNIRKVSPENAIISTDTDMVDVFTIIDGLEDLFVEYSISKSMIGESASSNIKLLSNKLRKAMQKASDIDKETSRKIDSSVNMFLMGMQRAARNDNREAIIRGSILPSTSKIVKATLLDTGVALINPALAIILAVGQFAMSKKMKTKERQLVLDEIDIEIEMCKRYLRQAEDQNDLEAQKKILRIQRNLERQKQRIEYNMKVHWNQDVPSVVKNDD